MTNDNQRSETLDRIARKLANASQLIRESVTSRKAPLAATRLGMAHDVASSALEELDKLVIREHVATPMFGGEA